VGDALAEGGWRAARLLNLGQDQARDRYPGWGYSAHCDGREGGRIVYPYWLVPALQWLCDTRDPYGSGHGYLWSMGAALRAADLPGSVQAQAGARAALLDQLRAVGKAVYGSGDAVDPASGYRGRAAPAHYHCLRAAIKDCLPVDAHFPLIYRAQAPDGYWRLADVAGVGEVEGPDVERQLFAAGTGIDWSEAEFARAAQRVCTLERALQVRHWGRDRATDESVLPYFEVPELHQSPYLDRRHGLDREQFAPLLDAFYTLHGWDPATGWPTASSLRDLGLSDLYQPMLDGAARAAPLPPPGPTGAVGLCGED
jgi:hypothetical protein